MIYPDLPQDQQAVADHYNSLSTWYLKLWGEHLHHGLWKKGDETPEEATKQLVHLIAEKGLLQKGERVCDIGCGYGATSKLLATEWDAEVTGLTLSEQQHIYATSHDKKSTYLIRDWMDNQLPSSHFDLAISVESSEHMMDKARFFSEAYRVLKPGGRLVICAWLSKENPKPWEVKYLLEPICREGRLPSMGSVSDYLKFFKEQGFEKCTYEDLSEQVKKTWKICAKRAIQALASKEFRALLFNKEIKDRIFLKTVFRLLAAYETKSMRYGIFTALKN